MLAFLLENSGPSLSLLVVEFPQMNFSQMHERLRLELLRRINRGTLSVSLLARQTGYGQSHLSNFLRQRRQLSFEALDRILTVQHLAVTDLLPASTKLEFAPIDEDVSSVPVVSHASAIFEPYVRPTAALEQLHLPANALRDLRVRCSQPRRAWQRFVAIRVADADASAMDPLVQPNSLAVLDRLYTSLAPYRPSRPTLYAVRRGAHLTVRFADFLSNRLVLRPLRLDFPIEALELESDSTPNDLIVGRVALLLGEP